MHPQLMHSLLLDEFGSRAPRSNDVARMLRRLLIASGLSLGLLGFTGAALYFYRLPATLTLAVGPPGSEDERLVTGIAQRLVANNASVRLKILTRDTPAAAGAALDAGEADLAVIRSDLGVPGTARAIAIFHRNVVIFMASPGGKIKRVRELAGKAIGVIGHPGINDAILETVLKHHNISLESVRVITIQSTDVAEAVRTKRVDALMAVGPQNGRAITMALSAFAPDARSPVFLDTGDAAGITKRLPAFEEAEIVAGTFGGNKPAETIKTLGFTHYLVGREGLRDSVVTEFTRLLFNLRPSLAIDFASAGRIEAPQTEKDARVPVHQGAAAYLDGEEKSFLDVYGDWLYYGILGFGVLGSAFTWIFRTLAPTARASNAQFLEQLVGILGSARKASTLVELSELERQSDEIFTSAVRKANTEALDEAQLMTFSLALEYVRQAIAGRRRSLADTAHESNLSSVSDVSQSKGAFGG